MTAKKTNKANSQSGNAFFIVMVSVVLFAALMYTFSRGARQGGNNLSDKRAEMAATELIAVAQRYQRGIDKLLLRGCSENQISFATDGDFFLAKGGGVINYSNPNSPLDESCHMFSTAGAGIVPYRLPPEYVVDSTPVCGGCSMPDTTYFTTEGIWGVGDDSRSELTMWLGRVQKNVCIAINDQLGVNNPGGNPPQESWDCAADAPFTGTFSSCVDPVGDHADIAGKTAFCIDFNGNGWTYIYMHVLLDR